MTPCVDSFEMEYDPLIVESIVPDPKTIPFLQWNQQATFFVKFKNIDLEDNKMKEENAEIQYQSSSTYVNLRCTDNLDMEVR